MNGSISLPQIAERKQRTPRKRRTQTKQGRHIHGSRITSQVTAQNRGVQGDLSKSLSSGSFFLPWKKKSASQSRVLLPNSAAPFQEDARRASERHFVQRTMHDSKQDQLMNTINSLHQRLQEAEQELMEARRGKDSAAEAERVASFQGERAIAIADTLRKLSMAEVAKERSLRGGMRAQIQDLQQQVAQLTQENSEAAAAIEAAALTKEYTLQFAVPAALGVRAPGGALDAVLPDSATLGTGTTRAQQIQHQAVEEKARQPPIPQPNSPVLQPPPPQPPLQPIDRPSVPLSESISPSDQLHSQPQPQPPSQSQLQSQPQLQLEPQLKLERQLQLQPQQQQSPVQLQPQSRPLSQPHSQPQSPLLSQQLSQPPSQQFSQPISQSQPLNSRLSASGGGALLYQRRLVPGSALPASVQTCARILLLLLDFDLEAATEPASPPSTRAILVEEGETSGEGTVLGDSSWASRKEGDVAPLVELLLSNAALHDPSLPPRTVRLPTSSAHDSAEFGDSGADDEASDIRHPCLTTPASQFLRRSTYTILVPPPSHLPSTHTPSEQEVRTLAVASAVREYHQSFDGFVVLCRTQTVPATAASLAFLVSGLRKPVVFAAYDSSVSMNGQPDTPNSMLGSLCGSLFVASHFAIPEVTVFCDGSLLRGTRVVLAKQRGRFSLASPSFPPLLHLGSSDSMAVPRVHTYADGDIRVAWDAVLAPPPPTTPLTVSSDLHPHVVVVRLLPGMSPAALANLLRPPVRGVVLDTSIAATGSSSVGAWLAAVGTQVCTVLRDAAARGILLVEVVNSISCGPSCTRNANRRHNTHWNYAQHPRASNTHPICAAATTTPADTSRSSGLLATSHGVLGSSVLLQQSHQLSDPGHALNDLTASSLAMAHANSMASQQLKVLCLFDMTITAAVAKMAHVLSALAHRPDEEIHAAMLQSTRGELSVLRFLPAEQYAFAKPLFLRSLISAVNHAPSLTGVPAGSRLLSPSFISRCLNPIMLHAAAAAGDLGAADRVVKLGISVSATDYAGRTALHTAAANGHLAVVKALVAGGSDVSARDCWNGTALEDAVRGRHASVAKYLEDRGARLPQLQLGVLLLQAAEAGDADRMASLADLGADLNWQNGDRSTALHVSARFGHVDAARLLLQRRANWNIMDRWGNRPADCAIRWRRIDVVSLLVQHGCQVRAELLPAVLCDAAFHGDLTAVRWLTQQGVQLDSCDYDKCTALKHAASAGHLAIVRYLLDHGCDIDQADRWGCTPLEAAIRGKAYPVVRHLVSHGATLPDTCALPLFFDVCSVGDTATLRALLLTPLAIDATDYDGRTGLHFAAAEGHLNTVRLLIEYGAEVNPQDRWGGVPLEDSIAGLHDLTSTLLSCSGAQVGVHDVGQEVHLGSQSSEKPPNTAPSIMAGRHLYVRASDVPKLAKSILPAASKKQQHATSGGQSLTSYSGEQQDGSLMPVHAKPAPPKFSSLTMLADGDDPWGQLRTVSSSIVGNRVPSAPLEGQHRRSTPLRVNPTTAGRQVPSSPDVRMVSSNFKDVLLVYTGGFCIPETAFSQILRACSSIVDLAYEDSKGPTVVDLATLNAVTPPAYLVGSSQPCRVRFQVVEMPAGKASVTHGGGLESLNQHLLSDTVDGEEQPEVHGAELFQLWTNIVSTIERNYETFAGFVVLQQTANVSVSAAALSFMLSNLGKPVVFAGANSPMSCALSDAPVNIISSLFLAGYSRIPEVCIYHKGDCFRGSRCVSSFDSVGGEVCLSAVSPPLATIATRLHVDVERILPIPHGKLRPSLAVSRDILVLPFSPSFPLRILAAALSSPVKGVVFEVEADVRWEARKPFVSVPSPFCEDLDAAVLARQSIGIRQLSGQHLETIRDAVQVGVVVVTVCGSAGGNGIQSSLTIGARRKALMRAGSVDLGDMTAVAAFAKLSVLLGDTNRSPSSVRKAMSVNVCGERTLDARPEISAVAATASTTEKAGRLNEGGTKAFCDPTPYKSIGMELGFSGDAEAMRLLARIFDPILLCWAASTGDMTLLQQLVQAGASVTSSDTEGRGPLHIAASAGERSCCEWLVQHGARINSRDQRGFTPLDHAMAHHHSETAMWLTTQGGHANPETVATLSCAVAGKGDLSQLQELVKYGVDMNASDTGDRTPLMFAAAAGHLETVQYLVETGEVSVDAHDKWGNTAADDALRHGHDNIAMLLTSWGSTLHRQHLATRLCEAAVQDDQALLVRMERVGANLNVADCEGRTALHLAACNGSMNALQYLLEVAKVEVNVTDRFGRTPTDDAFSVEDTRTIQRLRDFGGSCQDPELGIKLCRAAFFNRTSYFRRSPFSPKELDSGNFDNRTALHVAASEGHVELVRLLLERGVDCRAIDRMGSTPLQDAERHGHAAVISILRSFAEEKEAFGD